MVQITKTLPVSTTIRHLEAKPLKQKMPDQKDSMKRSIRKFVVKIVEDEANKKDIKKKKQEGGQQQAQMLRMELRMRYLAFKEEKQRDEVTALLENLKI